MAVLMAFENTSVPATVKQESTDYKTLVAGNVVKLELGNDDGDATVPAGEEWDVVASIRIVRRSV
jgi:hypothetical protein